MFLYSKWTALPISTRALLASKFGIPKIGTTHVQDNRIVSDGYKIEDVESALNIDAIQQYLGSDDTDMYNLFEEMVSKIEGREPMTLVPRKIETEEITATVTETVVVDTKSETLEPKKRGRPAKTK